MLQSLRLLAAMAHSSDHNESMAISMSFCEKLSDGVSPTIAFSINMFVRTGFDNDCLHAGRKCAEVTKGRKADAIASCPPEKRGLAQDGVPASAMTTCAQNCSGDKELFYLTSLSGSRDARTSAFSLHTVKTKAKWAFQGQKAIMSTFTTKMGGS